MQDDPGQREIAQEPGEDEQSEALSRAARDAVRQPADPRLERSFARLGLFSDADVPPEAEAGQRRRSVRPSSESTSSAPAGTRSRPTPFPPPEPVTVDVEPIRRELAAWRATADDLGRRLAVLTWVLLGLLVIIGMLAVVLIVRA